jgi:predicted AlkP superfamily pyrophosphatase or phosphodiesterase
MQKTVVLNIVGLTQQLIGPHTPRLAAFRDQGCVAAIRPVLPAVTCSAQATYLTGALPREHGIVGNGWYFRDECEVRFWRQSNKLVQRPKLWELARELEPSLRCANMFWWYNMYSSVDYAVTPRPMYPADGRKLPDIYTSPATLRPLLQERFGQFPLFHFWGPNAAITSTRWIADATLWVEERYNPQLSLVYLPHLDYILQKQGPNGAGVGAELRALDAVVGDLFDYYAERQARVVVLSEYGINEVSRPVHLNRVLRRHGHIAVRDELGYELLDAGASAAFAVADHQIAHVYINDERLIGEIRSLLEVTPGVLDEDGKRAAGLDHPRAGDLVVVAAPDSWFTYYYWLDDERAPDYARTVDIHRKPGYDPVELFLDPQLRLPLAKVGVTLLKKQLGFRYLMDVIPLDASLVKGSHGHRNADPTAGPLFMSSAPELFGTVLPEQLEATDVCGLLLQHLGIAAPYGAYAPR